MMASAASGLQSINNSASQPNPKDGPSRSVKQNSGPKMADKSRRESPSDSNRRPAAHKAWSGPNPITQRSSTPNQGKGNAQQNKPTTPSKMAQAKEQTLSDKHNYDRVRYLFGATVGLQVVLTTKSGDKFEGIFAAYSGSPNAAQITLKMTKKVPNSPITQPNGTGSWEAVFAGSSPDHTVAFDLKDVADMTIPELSLPEISRPTNGASTTFQTDADISGNTNRGERVLQRWVPDAADSTDWSLESSNAAEWDQFAVHDKMTGEQSTYSEEMYTTTIDRNAPGYRKREAEAARLAREIESQTSNNTHVREERGQALENDYGDEEDKYSGVRREQRDFLPLSTGSANRYTPPALRAPSAKASIAGVPVDSAIISAQLARPDGPRSSASSELTQVQTNMGETSTTQGRTTSGTQPNQEVTTPLDKTIDLSSLMANGSASKTVPSKQLASMSPQRQLNSEMPSQGVEGKVLDQFKQFANAERARLAEKKRVQASQDRTAKINELVRFAKNFKLKTPIPNDLVGILARDPKKQEAIMEKAQRDHEEAKTSLPSTTDSTPSSVNIPSVPKFDKSLVPGPIPDRNTLQANKNAYAKSSIGRGQRPSGQPMPFTGAGVPSAPRHPSASKHGQLPTPIPMPEVRGSQTLANASGLSSPRGTDTPTSAVSTKFNVRALEFRPTAPSFNPAASSTSAASPSPIGRVASVARTASPAAFFGPRKLKPAAERVDIMQRFNPIDRMKREVKNKVGEKSDEPVRDFAANGGIPNAYHTQPTWVDVVPEQNREKTYEDYFRVAPPAASPTQSRTSSSHTVPFHGQMQQMAGAPHLHQSTTPQHGNHVGQHFQPQFDEQRMHNGSPMFASPNMTPRNMYAGHIGHPAQVYGNPQYHGGGPMGMRPPYGNNAAMMHGQYGGMGAPMMVQQQSSGPYMGMPSQYGGVYPSPSPGHVYPQQQNGFPSPGRMAPVMMHQHSQQGHQVVGNAQVMYGPPGQMYGQQQQMRGAYAGNHTPYGTSPHQPHHMGQRAMSSGYGGKSLPQMVMNGGPPANAPQQPAAYGQTGGGEEAK